MHAFRIEPLLIGHFKQPGQNVTTNLGSTRLAGNPESITAACDLNIEAAFDLPQVFVKLAAEIRQAAVIGGF